ARDTYLFSYYRSKESRLHSSESKLADFVFESTKLKRYQLQKEIMYTTPTLEGYRNRIVQLAGEIPAAISSESRYGPQFNAPSKAPPQEITLLNWRAGLYDWKDFLQDYGERLTQLEIPQGDLTRIFTNQSRESLELWLTIFPTASHFRYLADSSEGGGSLLRRTRDWTVREVQKTLAANRSM
ncbi:MAG: hypothetical protein ACOC0D_03275, partial [Spirochaeta sp.]